jgi:hypothetical protein
MTYRFEKDGKTVARGAFAEVSAALKGAVTDLVAEDPEGASTGAMTANRAFASGAVSEAIAASGEWRTIVGVHGEPVRLAIIVEGDRYQVDRIIDADRRAYGIRDNYMGGAFCALPGPRGGRPQGVLEWDNPISAAAWLNRCYAAWASGRHVAPAGWSPAVR